jgi:GT2 family glycosyltransferase
MLGDRVGLVVLTYNRRDEVLRTLDRLACIDASVAIVVVDNGSHDGTAQAVAARCPRARVVRLPRNVGAAGRNAGVAACTTPYVAFCDDDTWWLPDSLACAAAALDAHRQLAAVTARVLVGADGREDPTNARMAASPFRNTLGVRGSEVLGFLAGACMVRRAAFVAAGGYDARLFLGREEALLAMEWLAAGWRMAYLPEAIVCHHPSRARDARGRRRLIARNALWCAWLRRPAADAWRETRRWLAASRADGEAMATALAALRGLPWVLRERRVAPPHVVDALRILDAFDEHRALDQRHRQASRPPARIAGAPTSPD